MAYLKRTSDAVLGCQGTGQWHSLKCLESGTVLFEAFKSNTDETNQTDSINHLAILLIHLCPSEKATLIAQISQIF